MTNKDKYLKEGITEKDIEKLAEDINTFYQNNIGLLPAAIQQFFNEIQKPTLTEDERVILKNIKNVGFNDIIGRSEEEGKLYLKGTAEMRAFAINTMYGHLFQFIKEGEEYEIAELLKGE